MLIKEDPYIRISKQTFYQWRVDSTGYIRLDELKSGKKCTPGKTIECGNVCRKPENCKDQSKTAKKTKSQTQKTTASKKTKSLDPLSFETKPETSLSKQKQKRSTAKSKTTQPAPIANTEATTEQKKTRSPKPKAIVQSPESSNNIPDLATAKSKLKLLGTGIEGEVYLSNDNPPRAIKYKSGGGKFDADVINNLKIAGDLGIAPKFHGLSGDKNAFSMDFLKDYEPGIHPSSLDIGDDLSPYNKSFLKAVKTAHDNGYFVGDLHEDNVMVNQKTQDVKFIDQGSLRSATWETKAQQLLDRFSSRPLAAETAENYLAATNRKGLREYKKLQKIYNNRDEKPLTDKQYEDLVTKTYQLLGV